MTSKDTILGYCPKCGREIHEAYLLVEYETEDGETGIWAECLECDDVVDPARGTPE